VQLRPEQWVRGTRSEDVIVACLDTVPAPSADEDATRP
jgi:hypothetical protein